MLSFSRGDPDSAFLYSEGGFVLLLKWLSFSLRELPGLHSRGGCPRSGFPSSEQGHLHVTLEVAFLTNCLLWTELAGGGSCKKGEWEEGREGAREGGKEGEGAPLPLLMRLPLPHPLRIPLILVRGMKGTISSRLTKRLSNVGHILNIPKMLQMCCNGKPFNLKFLHIFHMHTRETGLGKG